MRREKIATHWVELTFSAVGETHFPDSPETTSMSSPLPHSFEQHHVDFYSK